MDGSRSCFQAAIAGFSDFVSNLRGILHIAFPSRLLTTAICLPVKGFLTIKPPLWRVNTIGTGAIAAWFI